MSKSKEKQIPNIVLKYYKVPKKNDTSMPYFKCYCCSQRKNRSGGQFLDKKNKFWQICEQCAIWNYKEKNGFRTLKAASARRRRMFDVSYLFNETVLDMYMEIKGIKRFEDCINADLIFIKSTELFNYLFSKEEKVELEEIESQIEIEKRLKNRLAIVDLDNLFG